MKLHHIAIWTFRLEELKDFYVRFLGGTSNEKYINPKKGFESYFISFDEGPTLELMSRVDVQNTPIEENRRGLTHLAFTFPSKEEILRFTEEMRSEGYTIAGEPRTSGDGYFESVVLDPDGNRLECVYKKEPETERTETALSPNIETKRLLLRPFEENDAEAFFACCQNPNLGNNAGWAPHKTLNESREILHSTFIGQEGIWAVTLKDTQQLIASIGIVPDPKRENPQVRMLDGLAGDIWFITIYAAICLRLMHQPLPLSLGTENDLTWGWEIWILALISGTVCHSKQCMLADYYRNIHLFFLKGESGSELDTFKQQRTLFYSLPWKGNFWWKSFLYFYGNYTRQQEQMTPSFQRFYTWVLQKYGNDIPRELCDEFRRLSLPLMKYANILTFNTRAIVLYICLLIGIPYMYFVFEIVVMTVLFLYMRHRHEAICSYLYQKYANQ